MELIRPASDSRYDVDRRTLTWRTAVYGFLRSRRQQHRRELDDRVFSDRGHPWIFFLATGIMLLSATDAFLTLQLLQRGMIEANPIMDAIMAHGTMLFTASKLMLTAFGLLVLVFLAQFRFLNIIRVGLMLTTFFSIYACLICYELVNLFSLM